MLKVGATYQFNSAVARIASIEDGLILWFDVRSKHSTIRTVPKWYFARYAIQTTTPPEPRYLARGSKVRLVPDDSKSTPV